MTGPTEGSPALSRFHKFAAVVKDAVFLSTLIVSISAAVGSFAVTLAWPVFIEKLQEDLGVATRGDLLALQDQINRISGEDRIVRMPPGHSFVSEPVSQGEEINLTLVLSRTKRGLPCNYLGATPLFTDERGIPFAGAPLAPVKQVGLNPERLHLAMALPEGLLPGRVGVTLGMRFSCPFGPEGSYIDAYHEADPIFFQLDPAKD